MRRHLDRIAHTKQYQPRKQEGCRFKPPNQSRVEPLAQDHIGEGNQSHKAKKDGDGRLLNLIDPMAYSGARGLGG